MRLSDLVTTAVIVCGSVGVLAQERGAAPAAPGAPAGQRGAAPARGRAPLFFREEWKQTPAGGEHPVTPESIANPNLELKLYGTTSKEVQLTGSATDENNPTHVWTGVCTTPCAVAFRDKNNFADLSGLSRIKWVTKVSGFHQVRPIVKLADGTWLVGDHTDGSTLDWLDERVLARRRPLAAARHQQRRHEGQLRRQAGSEQGG